MATLKINQKSKAVSSGLALAKQVRHFPASNMWLDYDEEADVLYNKFEASSAGHRDD
jgi:hypothetical protein